MIEIYADLHLHSTFSDGRVNPAELVDALTFTTIHVASLTDHDTLDGSEAFSLAAAERGLLAIPGVELSTTHEEREIHLLGYGFDPGHDRLLSELERIKVGRVRRAEKIVDRLKEHQIVLDFDEIRASASNGLVTRPHIAQAMVRAGYVKDTGTAFDKYIADGLPAAVSKNFLTPAEGVTLLREAGAFVSVAHPGATGMEDLLVEMKAHGMAGLEVWHPKHPPRITDKLEKIAAEHGLLQTGGSDYHGFDTGFIGLGRFGLTRARYDLLARAESW